MNKTLSYILVGGASALVGAIAGYFFCKKRLQDKFEEAVSEAVNDELESIRRTRQDKTHEEPDAEETEDVVETRDSEEKDYDYYFKKAFETLKAEYPEEKSFNTYRVHLVASCLADCAIKGLDEEATSEVLNELIGSFAESDKRAEEIEEDFEEEEDPCVDEDEESNNSDEPQLVMEEYADKPPEVIPLSEYRCLPPYFEFITFHYFEEDDVLIDDNDRIIDDIELVIGDALLHFDEEEEDGDTVYVLNGSMGWAIEVERLHSSYAAFNGWGDYARR